MGAELLEYQFQARDYTNFEGNQKRGDRVRVIIGKENDPFKKSSLSVKSYKGLNSKWAHGHNRCPMEQKSVGEV